jgi:transcription elongation factor GreB
VSKAFTKDDGPAPPEVHRHRAPLPAGAPNYVTSRGLLALREELARLDAADPGPDPAASPPTSHDPWRSELEERIATAWVAPPPADRSAIRFGASIRVGTADGHTRDFQIVGVDETDPGAGRIGFGAPLARALLGHRVGERITVQTPHGEEELAILGVAYDEDERL